MAALLEIVAGWTGMIGPFTLKIDGTPQPLTGMTVSLVLHNSLGALIVPAGTVTQADQLLNPGQVYFTPASTDFVLSTGLGASPVRQQFWMHWKVVDGSGKVVFFPNAGADEVLVHRA